MAVEPDAERRLQERLHQLDVLEAHYFRTVSAAKGRDRGRSRHNPMFVWAAINICACDAPGLPLPGWVSFYLGSVALRLVEAAEGVDRANMPQLEVADDAPNEVLVTAVRQVGEGRAQWLAERHLADKDAGPTALKILGFQRKKGENVFREYAATLQKQTEALDAEDRRQQFNLEKKRTGKRGTFAAAETERREAELQQELDKDSVGKRLYRAGRVLALGLIQPLPNGPEATRRRPAKGAKSGR